MSSNPSRSEAYPAPTGLHRRSRQGGFTLIEVLVVVVILGLMASIVVPRIMGSQDKAMITKARQDIRAIETAMDMYRLDNFAYPSTEQGIEALVERPTGQPEPRNYQQGGYLSQLPMDPWGRPYQYRNPGVHGEIDVYTLGADGAPGGEGMDADIGNWNID